MAKESLNFEEYRKRRDKDTSLVPCARCGKSILSTSIRCPECGVHFKGEAYDFRHASEQDFGRSRVKRWMLVVVVFLLAALLFAAVG